MLTCDIVHTALGARYLAAPFAAEDLERLSDDLARLERTVMQQFEHEGIGPEEVALEREVAVRYRRQAHTLPAAVDPGAVDREGVARIQERFERRYSDVYGEGALLSGAAIELEAQAVSGTRPLEPPPLSTEPIVSGDGSGAVRGERLAHFGGRFVSTPVLDGAALRAGEVIAGPAIIQRMGDSVVIPEGFRAEVDKYLSLATAGAGA
jgi:N-methylhydantoinase A